MGEREGGGGTEREGERERKGERTCIESLCKQQSDVRACICIGTCTH